MMLGAKTIDQMVDELLAREGGYVDNPDDKGGKTNFGITETVARANGYQGDMRALPREFAVDLYKRLYWQRPHFDEVAQRSPAIAAELFDTGVNMSPIVAATFLQRALTALNREGKDYPDLTPDGRIGEVTLRALSAFLALRGTNGENVMLAAMNALQGERYIRLAERSPRNETFLYGWLANRV